MGGTNYLGSLAEVGRAHYRGGYDAELSRLYAAEIIEVPGNLDSLWTLRTRLTQLWRAQLLRRSHRRRLTWECMNRLVDRWLPAPRVLHPGPITRFAANHPR